jgi:hypothetical protein
MKNVEPFRSYETIVILEMGFEEEAPHSVRIAKIIERWP